MGKPVKRRYHVPVSQIRQRARVREVLSHSEWKTRLVIAGSRCALWGDVLPLLKKNISLVNPDVIISGESPSDLWKTKGAKAGMDSLSKLYAHRFGIPFRGFPAALYRWKGRGGFRDRNAEMICVGTHFFIFVSLRSTSYGSGWTGDRAEELGKTVYRWKVK